MACVSVHPQGDARGHVQLAKKVTDIKLASLPPEDREDLGTRLLLVALGGAASLTVLEGNACWPEAAEDMAVYDDTANQMEIPIDERDGMFFRLFGRAVRMITDNRQEIENLAAVLVKKETLNKPDIQHLMALAFP